ncbi:hypothetical protein QAD02_020339 [Eretmocerus hayati]|uniref:Uncharacterized protein n=1 Tax=Eretmocerus hayati TaxID=131215 RepID=A0ACC2PMC8_9HYME|nr:hypothetical protein QAD02_020339 [Eretmocerus hayati]
MPATRNRSNSAARKAPLAANRPRSLSTRKGVRGENAVGRGRGRGRGQQTTSGRDSRSMTRRPGVNYVANRAAIFEAMDEDVNDVTNRTANVEAMDDGVNYVANRAANVEAMDDGVYYVANHVTNAEATDDGGKPK